MCRWKVERKVRKTTEGLETDRRKIKPVVPQPPHLFPTLLRRAAHRAVCQPRPQQLLLPRRGAGRLHLRQRIPHGRQLIKLSRCYRTGLLPAVPKITVFIFLKFMRFRRQLCACHQALGVQHTTWPVWTPPSLARAGWSRPASPSTSSTSCLPFSLSSLFLSSFSIVVAGACAPLVPGGCQSVELYPPTTSPGSPKNSQRRQSGALEVILAHLLPPRHLFLPQTLLDQGFTVCRQD